MVPGRVPGPGHDDDPARDWRLPPAETDWMDDDEWAARRASQPGEYEPGDPDLDEDPDSSPPPGLTGAQLAELISGAREITAAGGIALMGFADSAAGADDRYAGSDDDELVGAIRAWDRVQAHGTIRWTAPSGRTYTTEPTQYPI
jgi:hypothetical protein